MRDISYAVLEKLSRVKRGWQTESKDQMIGCLRKEIKREKKSRMVSP